VSGVERSVAVSLVDGWWVVQNHKWQGTKLLWSGQSAAYRELDSAVAAAEFRQRNRLAAGQTCVVQLCAEALAVTR